MKEKGKMAKNSPLEKVNRVLSQPKTPVPPPWEEKPELAAAFRAAVGQGNAVLSNLKESCSIETDPLGKKFLRDDESSIDTNKAVDVAFCGAFKMVQSIRAISLGKNEGAKLTELVPLRRFSRSLDKYLKTLAALPTCEEKGRLLSFAQAAPVALNMRRAVLSLEFAQTQARQEKREATITQALGYIAEAARLSGLDETETQKLQADFIAGKLPGADSYIVPVEKAWNKTAENILQRLP